MSDVALIYATFPDEETALSIGEGLVKERLAACVNVLPPITSVYAWKGNIERSREAAAVIKTRRASWDAVRTYIKNEHPYETPVIAMINLDEADEDARRWILEYVLLPIDTR